MDVLQTTVWRHGPHIDQSEACVRRRLTEDKRDEARSFTTRAFTRLLSWELIARKLPPKTPGVEPRTLLLWGKNANHVKNCFAHVRDD